MLGRIEDRALAPVQMNDTAYVLADTGTELPEAKRLAESAIRGFDDTLKHLTLSKLTNEQLLKVANRWLGELKDGRSHQSQAYTEAAWLLIENAVPADHLGEIYEALHNKAEALHYYKLALAAQPKLAGTKERLKELESSLSESDLRQLPAAKMTPAVEITKLLVLLLFANKGVEEARFIKGDEALKGHYNVSIPDAGPEKK